MTSTLQNIQPGDFTLTADCPECDREVVLPVALSVTLTVTHEGGTLRARLSTKRVEHNCSGEQTVPLFEGNGLAAAPELSDR
jgi:hypothetical protein